MNYSKALRIVRARLGVSQQVFSELAQIDSSLVSRFESEARKPSKKILKKISDNLKIPLELLDLLALEKEDYARLPKGDVEKVSKELLGLLT